MPSKSPRRRRPSPTSVIASHDEAPAPRFFERLLDAAFERLSNAWPLNLAVYAVTLPLAEAAFYLQTKSYLRQRSAAPHDTFSGEEDTQSVLSFWDELLSEEDAASLW